MIKTFLVLIALLGAQPCYTQQQMISGTVYSMDTLRSLPGLPTGTFTIDTSALAGCTLCLLHDLEHARPGTPCPLATVTDFDGKFALAVPETLADSFYYMEASAPDRQSLILALSPGIYNNALVLFMHPDTFVLPLQAAPSGEPITKERFVSKPAIYLYPTQQTKVSVKHSFKGTVGTTYPDYGTGWEVIADTNGSLLNTKDNRRYEYLFWDGKCRFPAAHFDFKDGFVIKKEESQAFLWKTLAAIGLNNKEINDFVVYWLPQLEQHEQNFIHFRVNDDIDHSSILTVVPKPDSWIRIFMEFKPVDPGFHIPPQALPTCARKGFTLVEWGGAKLEEELSIQ